MITDKANCFSLRGYSSRNTVIVLWRTERNNACTMEINSRLLVSVFSKIRGPFFLGSSSDPAYAYLFNALSVSQGLPVGHIDHPGTPVQSLGAIVINCINFINHKPDVISEVLKNPEYFLNSIFIIILILLSM